MEYEITFITKEKFQVEANSETEAIEEAKVKREDFIPIEVLETIETKQI